jgi:predicted secreted protein
MSQSAILMCAVYFVIWWVVLFAVLPWGVKSQDEEGEVLAGSEPGAPVRPLLLRKLAATTVIAAIILGAGYMAWISGLNAYILPPEVLGPR